MQADDIFEMQKVGTTSSHDFACVRVKQAWLAQYARVIYHVPYMP